MIQTFELTRGESPGMRYLRFNRWLREIALDASQVPRVALIVYEQPHHRGGAAIELAAGLATRVQEFGAVHGIEHAAVHSATLKKFATGSGRADKAAMLGAAGTAFGYAGADDDEADALWLLAYARRELLGGPSGLGPPGHGIAPGRAVMIPVSQPAVTERP